MGHVIGNRPVREQERVHNSPKSCEGILFKRPLSHHNYYYQGLNWQRNIILHLNRRVLRVYNDTRICLSLANFLRIARLVEYKLTVRLWSYGFKFSGHCSPQKTRETLYCAIITRLRLKEAYTPQPGLNKRNSFPKAEFE